jgi:t-SNARE complex subunit (syntaxin)
MAARDRLGELRSGNTQYRRNDYEMSSRTNGNGFTDQINQLFNGIDRIEGNLSQIQRLHERALVGVSQDEINRITRQLDSVQDETNDMMDRIRVELKSLSQETKRVQGSEQQSRKAQQASVASKLQQVAQRYAQIQKGAKEQYKRRMEREIKIGIMDLCSSP